MYATKNPVIVLYQLFAVSSVVIFPVLFMLLIRQQPLSNDAFPTIFIFSCFIGLICAFTLLLKFELPKFAFPGIAIHLFALFMVSCC